MVCSLVLHGLSDTRLPHLSHVRMVTKRERQPIQDVYAFTMAPIHVALPKNAYGTIFAITPKRGWQCDQGLTQA